jgi:uncharacterized protein (TIGR03435 family)
MRLLSIGIALLMLVVVAAAQSPPAAAPGSSTRLTFEVATIKPNKSGDQRSVADALPSGRVTAINVPLHFMVRNAYQLQPYEMVMGPQVPSWFESDRWDVIAQAPANSTPDQWRVMLQNLIVERFKLVVRRELRDIPAYALVFARPDRRFGPQLKPSSLDCAALDAAARTANAASGPVALCGTDISPDGIRGRGALMSRLARNLSPMTGRYVLDATGLTERFDFELKLLPDPAQAAGGALTDGASVFTAVQEQLGLRLEARQTPIEVFFIESAQRPLEE